MYKNQIVQDTFEHARTRLMERYGLDISPEEHDKVIDQIQLGFHECIKKQSNTRRVYSVTFKGEEAVCIYSTSRKCIVTFLHKTHISDNGNRRWKKKSKKIRRANRAAHYRKKVYGL